MIPIDKAIFEQNSFLNETFIQFEFELYFMLPLVTDIYRKNRYCQY